MTIEEKRTPHHWNYFLALEDDLLRLARYVEPTEANFSTYSIELARLLSAAAAEVDVVAKQLCKKINGKSKANSIGAYMNEITVSHNDFASATVFIPKHGLVLHPWINWRDASVPVWWTANNKIKHHRHTHFEHANLKNALNAICGLFIMLLYFYEEEGRQAQLNPDPVLLRPGEPFTIDYSFYAPQHTIYSRNGLVIVQNPVT